MKRLSVAVLALVLLVPPALAATRQEHKFKLAFTATKAKSPTGISFLTDRFAYQAPPQGELADRVDTTTFVMARGTRTNVNAYPACSQAALEERGPDACPPKSKVGTGKAVVITGLPIDPIKMTAEIFAKRNGLLTYLTGAGQTQVIALSMKGNKIVAKVPQKCLIEGDCSKGEAVLKTLSVKLAKGKLITTPRSCPKSRKWTNKVIYKYVNGDTETQTSSSSCRR